MNEPTGDFQLHRSTEFLVATYPAGASFGPRRLRDYEFVWMLEGDAIYVWNGKRHEAPQGAIVLCRPDAVDSFRWDSQRRTRHAYFHFMLYGSLPESWPKLREWPLVRTPRREDDLLHILFRHLLSWNGRGDPAHTQSLTNSLLAAYVTGETETAPITPPGLPEPVARALTFISETLDSDPAAKITLNDLASAACVTPEYLCRLFARTTEQSPVEAVRISRLNRAVVLLTHTDFSITEIARMTGFDSPFHFSRVVKTMYGMSPRALRHASTGGIYIPKPRPLP